MAGAVAGGSEAIIGSLGWLLVRAMRDGGFLPLVYWRTRPLPDSLNVYLAQQYGVLLWFLVVIGMVTGLLGGFIGSSTTQMWRRQL